MRAVGYRDGRSMIEREATLVILDVPKNSEGRGILAYQISDGSILVLAKYEDEYKYEWYAKGEL